MENVLKPFLTRGDNRKSLTLSAVQTGGGGGSMLLGTSEYATLLVAKPGALTNEQIEAVELISCASSVQFLSFSKNTL